MKFEKSQALFDEAEKVLATGVSSGFRKNVKPVQYFERADGPYYIDVDGNEFVDYSLAWGPLIVGSNHPVLNEAVTQQLSKGYTVGAQHRLEVDLARKMVDSIPGLEQVIFSNTGSEANQAAIRIARAGTGRDKIIRFEGHYHGWMNNVLVGADPDAPGSGKPAASCGGQPASEFADTYVLPWNDLDVFRNFLEDHPHEIACVLTEPILVNAGSCMPREGYLAGLLELCREHGAVSIFDEVITGYRIALGGAREYFDLEPDLSIYAKAMAGGFSVSAVGGKAGVFDVLRSGGTSHFGTYNGSGPNLAAALATINLLSEPGVYDCMHAHGHAIREQLEQSAAEHGHPMVTTGVGTAFSCHFDLTEPPLTAVEAQKANMDKYTVFRSAMMEQGVLILPDGRWYLGLTHSNKELEKTTETIKTSMEKL